MQVFNHQISHIDKSLQKCNFSAKFPRNKPIYRRKTALLQEFSTFSSYPRQKDVFLQEFYSKQAIYYVSALANKSIIRHQPPPLHRAVWNAIVLSTTFSFHLYSPQLSAKLFRTLGICSQLFLVYPAGQQHTDLIQNYERN